MSVNEWCQSGATSDSVRGGEEARIQGNAAGDSQPLQAKNKAVGS